MPPNRFLNYSLADIFNIDLYSRQTFHKSFSTAVKSSVSGSALRRSVNKTYRLSGFGGETVRNYWFMSMGNFLAGELRNLRPYPPALANEAASSVKKILKSGFGEVCFKYGIKDMNSPCIPQYLYQESRCRHHFGKIMLSAYFENSFTLAPLLDPVLRTLRLETAQCPDPDLLMTLIFVRYEPALLQFPIQGKRSFNPATVAFAQRLNEIFPCAPKTISATGTFNLLPCDLQAEEILSRGRNNENFFGEIPERCLKAAFDSSRTRGLFGAYFDDVFYQFAKLLHANADFYTRSRFLYSVWGITRVLEDVEISNRRPYRDVARFIEQDLRQ